MNMIELQQRRELDFFVIYQDFLGTFMGYFELRRRPRIGTLWVTVASKQPRRSGLPSDLEFITQSAKATKFVWTVLAFLDNLIGRSKMIWPLLVLSASPQLKTTQRRAFNSQMHLPSKLWRESLKPKGPLRNLLSHDVYFLLSLYPVSKLITYWPPAVSGFALSLVSLN